MFDKAENFAKMLDDMNQEEAQSDLRPEDDGWKLPAARSLMLEQLIAEAEADEALADVDVDVSSQRVAAVWATDGGRMVALFSL